MIKGPGGKASKHLPEGKLKEELERREREEQEREPPVSSDTVFLWNLYQLKQQGYPFGPDDLDLKTWFEFAVVDSVINEIKAEQIKHG